MCGSEKFPAKDPFVELAKGSLNTFLNAMTYPDKTVYPIASCNDADFQNLMHVYLDAVFHPNIYIHDKIFRQEGWHYELTDKDAPLIYNGVVYNEMKGALSSPEDMLDSEIMRVLYPDTPYFHESGGDPKVIPELTYEAFLDFHRKYYHPSNCYIYLYGDMDMAEKLAWIDEKYLSHYEYLEMDSSIALQKPFAKPVEKTVEYPVSEEETDDAQAYLSYSTVVGTSLDADLYLAFQVLEYALLSAPGAPLKKALLDAGKTRRTTETTHLGSYRGFELEGYVNIITSEIQILVKGELGHTFELSSIATLNLTRLDNVIQKMPEQMELEKS